MGGELEKLKGDFPVVVRREAIKAAIYAVITFAGLMIAFVRGHGLWTGIDKYQYWLALLGAGLVALLYLWIRQKADPFLPTFSRLSSEFEIVEKEIFYQYKSATSLTYKKRIRLRALRHGLQVYHDQYSWTGRGTINVRCAVNDHAYVETVRKNVWQLYEIRLHKMLHKGEDAQTELIWDLEDREGSAVPFLSADVYEPTQKLVLKLQLPTEFGVKRVICDTYYAFGAQTALKSEELPISDEGKVEWVVNRPKLLYHYEIRWVMPKEQP